MLKYTYVFAYYLVRASRRHSADHVTARVAAQEDGPEKELFEFLQQDLEKSVEQLSENRCTERDTGTHLLAGSLVHILSEQPAASVDSSSIANLTNVTEKASGAAAMAMAAMPNGPCVHSS